MAGVFDIDLDQPEENVSDDETDEVLCVRVVTAETLCCTVASCEAAGLILLLLLQPELSGLFRQA